MESSGRKGKVNIRMVIGIVFVLGLLIAARYFLDLEGILKQVLRRIQDLGVWAPIVFSLIYILATVLFIPGSILTLCAGVLFGVVWGTVTVSVASTLGATAAFFVGRYLARGWIEKKISGRKKFAAVDRAVSEEGWKIVLLTRLSPVFPFNLLNYAFGLTRVFAGGYVLGSWVGMLPGTLMYVYLGSLAGSLAMLGTGQRSRSPWEWALYGFGLVATVILTVYITRVARRALNKRIPGEVQKE